MRIRSLLTLTLFLLVPRLSDARLVDAGDVDVRFLAKGPAGMKINGRAPSLSAEETDGKLKIVVPVTDLKTGMGLRDKHLRGYLQTAKHPNASFSVARDSLVLPAEGKEATAKSKGRFTLKGVTKTVPFSYKAKRTGSDYHVQALATIDIRDFEVEIPCYLGVCVDPEVRLRVRFKLRER